MSRTITGRAGLGLTVAITMALAACGGGASQSTEASSAGSAASSSEASAAASAEPTQGTALNACELITPADIEAALELEPGTVAEGELEEVGTVLDPAETECTYQDEAWGGVILRLTPTDGVNLFDAVLGAYDDAESIDAGDGAFWSPDTNRAFISKGSVTAMLQIGFVAVDSAEWGTVAEELVHSIEAKL
ncbi:MAG TPA: hypothetical protein VFH90_00080 [Candidatus Limnocylindria bacterium]|nr:hypothetical protein [Candidatus Limnocylindria bacterium]